MEMNEKHYQLYRVLRFQTLISNYGDDIHLLMEELYDEFFAENCANRDDVLNMSLDELEKFYYGAFDLIYDTFGYDRQIASQYVLRFHKEFYDEFYPLRFDEVKRRLARYSKFELLYA